MGQGAEYTQIGFLEKKMGEDYVDLACVVCLIQYPWWELNSLHGC